MKTTNYVLGAGPHAATRVEHPSGVVDVKMFNGAIVGSGNDARSAAGHLADQLRTLADLVERHEGSPRMPIDPPCDHSYCSTDECKHRGLP